MKNFKTFCTAVKAILLCERMKKFGISKNIKGANIIQKALKKNCFVFRSLVEKRKKKLIS